MALSAEQSRIWQAMNIGAQWILRSGTDPLLAQETKAQEAAQSSAPEIKVSAATQPVVRPTTAAGRTLPRAPVSLKPAARPAPAVRIEPVRAQAALAQPDVNLCEAAKTAAWEELPALIDKCRACPMSSERTHTVVAVGRPGCPIVLVGEAPGQEEDLQGIPFVGKSGQLLTQIVEACGLKRGENVAIVNVLKCRPPRNRDPKPDEVEACAAFLDRQLQLLQPSVVVLMGRIALQRLTGMTQSVGSLRGKRLEVMIAGKPTPAIVTYHPSYLLRNPVAKELGWHDIVFAKRMLAEVAGQTVLTNN